METLSTASLSFGMKSFAKKIVLFVCGCICSATIFAQTHSFQLWTGVETSYELTNALALEFGVESRFQQTGAALKQISAEFGLSYSLTKSFFVGASCEYADKYKKNGYFPVYTFAGTVGYKKKLGNFKIGIQTKLNLEKNTYLKSLEDEQLGLVDKNKIKVSYKLSKRLKPSLFVETYHPLEMGNKYKIATVKYGANCAVGFRKQLDLDFGYMFRHEVVDNEFISIVTITLSKSF